MKPALIGRKIGMTQVIDATGEVTPVTIVHAGPCTVLQVKSSKTDGYNAVQLGFEDIRPHRSTRAQIGHAGKAGTGPKRAIRELRLAEPPDVELGDVVTVDVFTEGEVKHVDVSGQTKGRGFTGPMARWGFGGQPASHGTERKHRSPGSIGGHANLGLGRGIKKGKKMAGRTGNDNMTQKCLELVKVDTDNDILLVKGSIPGPNQGIVFIRQSKTKA